MPSPFPLALLLLVPLSSAPAACGEPPTGGDATAPKPRAAAAPAYQRMKKVALVDREGFAEPVEAATLLIPTDWRWEGSVRWNPRATCAGDAVSFVARATSPDGLWAIEFLNPKSWQWSDDPAAQELARMQAANGGCETGPPLGAADFVRQVIVPRTRPGARVLGTEPLAEIAALQQRAGEEQLVELFRSGYATAYRVDAARVRLAYSVGGKPVEESITANVKTLAMKTTSATAAMNGQIAYTQAYNVLADDLVAVRGPAGEIEKSRKLFASIVGSVRKNQRYLAALTEVFAAVGKAQIEGARDRSRIWTRYANETNEIITKSYANQQAVQDRLARQYDESIRGVETFWNPKSKENVELVGGYERAWVNDRGEYLLSDQAGFDPAVALKEDWTALEKPRR